VKAIFEELEGQVSPHIIFTHNRHDAHQDHRLIAAPRALLGFEYEIPKYDGDLGPPSVFVPLEQEVCKRKIQYIMDAFHSPQSKRWFREDTFPSHMRLRDMECNACAAAMPRLSTATSWCFELIVGAQPDPKMTLLCGSL
jgi:hypothetical protein